MTLRISVDPFEELIAKLWRPFYKIKFLSDFNLRSLHVLPGQA